MFEHSDSIISRLGLLHYFLSRLPISYLSDSPPVHRSR